MRRAILGLVLATLAALGLPAFAGHTDQTDPNDTRGRLDVQAVHFTHGSGPLTWRFVTFSSWTVREIWDSGYLIVELDMKGDQGIDHLLIVRSDGRELEATLYRVRPDGTQREMTTVDVEKNGPRASSVSVAFHKLEIGTLRIAYFWSASTSLSGPACPRTCIDRVPDVGMVEQLLPGVTPTPTPTPTGTPTPTPTGTPTPTPTPTPSPSPT